MKAKRTVTGLLGFLSVLVLLGGCASLPKGKKRPQEEGGDAVLRHQMVEALKERQQRLQSLKSMATVRYGSKVFGVHGETAIVVKRPYLLRVDGISDFGQYDSQLAITRGDLTIVWMTERLFFKGLATPDTLFWFTHVALLPEGTLDLVMGIVPLEAENDYVLHPGRHSGEWILTGDRGEIVLTREGKNFLPVLYTGFDVDGSHIHMFEFDDYRDTGGTPFSYKRRVRFMRPHSKLEINFHDVEVNPRVNEDLFELKIPDDATKIEN